jgi:hypothetical protein
MACILAQAENNHPLVGEKIKAAIGTKQGSNTMAFQWSINTCARWNIDAHVQSPS